MMDFLREFQSYHWNCDFDDAELEAAFDATNTATTPDGFRRPFLVLLRSDDTVARGIALDFYDRAAITARFGEDNPFAPYLEEVIAVAREMLLRPPRPGDDIAPEGADHTSALSIFQFHAGAEDAELVLGLLRRHPDGKLANQACKAARTVLRNSKSPDPRLVALLGEKIRDALAPGPHSTYWKKTDPQDPRLLEAHTEMRTPTSEQAHRQAFRTMLHSGDTMAVGIALDLFNVGKGLARFDLDTQEFGPEVLTVARYVLKQPPSTPKTLPKTRVGASHASAFDAFALLAEPEDAPLLAAALRRRNTPALVRERAFRATKGCLHRWNTPDEQLVAAVEELIFDPAAAMDDRTRAVITLFDIPGPQVTAVLLRAAHSSDLPIQIEGALGLALIDQHRDLVRDLVASWPHGDDAPQRAWVVRHAFRD